MTDSQIDDGFGSRVSHVLSEVYELLLEKNRKYGDSALNPIRVFSKRTLPNNSEYGLTTN